jgi:AcrR family transcriptional regulator
MPGAKNIISPNILSPPPAPATRKPRADGIQSRQAILAAAASLATVKGLEGLSIGELARHIGMSKSGLYAHFKSKEELELATIDTAAEIFQHAVLDAVPETSTGLDRIDALTEAFLGHLAQRVFPGGCFFAAVGVQLAPTPGPARDRVMQFMVDWNNLFTSALAQAQSASDVARNVDLDQLAFEITAMLFRANFAWIVSNNPAVLHQARVGIRNALDRAGAKSPARKRTSSARNKSRK